jgi:hypothetical protein
MRNVMVGTVVPLHNMPGWRDCNSWGRARLDGSICDVVVRTVVPLHNMPGWRGRNSQGRARLGGSMCDVMVGTVVPLHLFRWDRRAPTPDPMGPTCPYTTCTWGGESRNCIKVQLTCTKMLVNYTLMVLVCRGISGYDGSS